MLIVRRSDFSGLLGVRLLEIDLDVLTLEAGFESEDLLSDGRGLEGERNCGDG